jgi:uncharacterized membrane protein YphA (DoxX/SURF4 family)
MIIGEFHTTVLAVLVRAAIAFVLFASSISKINNLRHYASIVASYQILPVSLVHPFAFSFPWIEAAIALLLLLGWQTRLAAALSALLMLMFILAIGVNLGRGRRDLECGCFGSGHSEKIGWKLIGRDTLLLLLSLLLVRQGGGAFAIDHLPASIQQAIFEKIIVGIGLNLALAGVGLYLVYRLVQQLGRLVRLVPLEQ